MRSPRPPIGGRPLGRDSPQSKHTYARSVRAVAYQAKPSNGLSLYRYIYQEENDGDPEADAKAAKAADDAQAAYDNKKVDHALKQAEHDKTSPRGGNAPEFALRTGSAESGELAPPANRDSGSTRSASPRGQPARQAWTLREPLQRHGPGAAGQARVAQAAVVHRETAYTGP